MARLHRTPFHVHPSVPERVGSHAGLTRLRARPIKSARGSSDVGQAAPSNALAGIVAAAYPSAAPPYSLVTLGHSS